MPGPLAGAGRRDRSWLFAVLTAGTVAVYIPGVTVLYLNLNLIQQKTISLYGALKVGCVVFLLGDLIKIGVVLCFGPNLRRLIREGTRQSF